MASVGLAGWGYEDVLPYFKKSDATGQGESEFTAVTDPFACPGPA